MMVTQILASCRSDPNTLYNKKLHNKKRKLWHDKLPDFSNSRDMIWKNTSPTC